MRFKILPIFLAFLLMGVADAMGPLSGAVKTKFQLSSFRVTQMPCFVSTTPAVGVKALMDPAYLSNFQN
jgi:hypothetical protein